jgi:glyoxylase-like metal-dependent hydrolase (beta-lactamase superfamily II)
MTINRRHFLQAAAAVPVAAVAIPATVKTAAASGAKAESQVPGIYRFSIGDAQVTALLDGYFDLPTDMVNGFDAVLAKDSLARNMQTLTGDTMQGAVNSYLVNTGGHLTLIDTGAAQLMGPTLGNLGRGLKAVGVEPKDIDTVLLTHIHPDHTGGLVDANGKAVFENAELSVAKAEWDFWHDDAIMASVPEGSRVFFQMGRDTTAPYSDRLRLFESEEQILPGMTSMPLPGHTPGHSGFTLNSGDASMLFWGDIIHAPGVQFTHPDWTVVFDIDPALAAQTRHHMLDRASADNMLVTGMHIDFPGLGRVLRNGDSYRFQAAPWQYAL